MANNPRLCLFFFAFLLLALEATDARLQYQGNVKSSSVSVTFRLQQHTEYGNRFVIVGSSDELGNWDTAKGLLLEYSDTDVWSGVAVLKSESILEMKAAIVKYDDPSKIIEWYNGDNLVLVVPSNGSAIVFLHWCSSSSSSSSSMKKKEKEMMVRSGSTMAVQFQILKQIEFGQRFGISGNQDALGNWDTAKSSLMKAVTDSVWVTITNAELPIEVAIEYKANILDYNTNDLIEWMPDPNRELKLISNDTTQLAIVPVAWNACPSSTLFRDKIISELESILVI